MKTWLAFPALLLSVLLPAAARAAAPDIAQKFAAVLQNPGHRQLVLQAARATPAWAHAACAAARFTNAPEIAVYLPILFDSRGEPVSGEWRERVIASGCGAPMTLNVLTQITAPATLATGFLLPGTTIADPILQNAAQSAAVKAAGGIPPGCATPYIADTEFSGKQGQGSVQTGPWTEIWTLDLCGPPKQVVMRFAVTGTRVSIEAGPRR